MVVVVGGVDATAVVVVVVVVVVEVVVTRIKDDVFEEQVSVEASGKQPNPAIL